MSSTQPEFFIQGNDGRQYPADANSLAEWIRAGTVAPDQMVYVNAEQRWVRARDLPQFSAAAPPAAAAPAAPKPNRKPLLIGCLILIGIFGILILIGSLVPKAPQSATASKPQANDAALRAKAPDVAKRLTVHLDAHDAAIRAKDARAADAAVSRAAMVLEPYLELKPVPPELAEPLQRYETAKKSSDLRTTLMKEHYNEIIAKQGEAAGLIQNRQWIGAERVLKRALEVADREIQQRKEAQGLFMPEDFDPELRKKQIEKVLRNVTVSAEKDRKEKQQAEALMAICGEKPVISPFNGGNYQIEAELKKRAHDPKSIDVTNCTVPVLYRDVCWVTTCDVRGKNVFGGLVLNRRKFSISKLGVTETK